MRLEPQDYVVGPTTDGGFYAYSSANMQCSACGDSPEEAIENLANVMEEYISDMHLVEDFI